MDTISEVALLDSKQNAEDLAEIANQRARKNIIAILSDSIGVAYNAFSYTRYLTWIPGLVVRNHTMGGYRIQDATNTLIPQMFAVKPIPEKAITMIGINNYFHNDTIEIAKAEYIEMVATLVKNNIIPIICTIAPLKDPTAWIVNFNRWLRYFARTNGYQLVDAYSAYYDAAGTLKTNYLQEDGVHATSLGEYAIYKEIEKVLDVGKTDWPLYVVGESHIIDSTHGRFIGDENADGLADWWMKFEFGGATVTPSLVARTVGNWQQITYIGASADSSAWLYIPGLASNFAVGDEIEASFDFESADLSANFRMAADILFKNAGGDTILTVSMLGYDSLPLAVDPVTLAMGDIGSYRVVRTMFVPADTAEIQVLFTLFGSATAIVKFGDIVIRRIG